MLPTFAQKHRIAATPSLETSCIVQFLMLVNNWEVVSIIGLESSGGSSWCNGYGAGFIIFFSKWSRFESCGGLQFVGYHFHHLKLNNCCI